MKHVPEPSGLSEAEVAKDTTRILKQLEIHGGWHVYRF